MLLWRAGNMLKRWGKTELLGHAEGLLRVETTHWQASRLGSSFSIYHRPVFAPRFPETSQPSATLQTLPTGHGCRIQKLIPLPALPGAGRPVRAEPAAWKGRALKRQLSRMAAGSHESRQCVAEAGRG